MNNTYTQKYTFNIVKSTIHPMLPCEQRPFDLSRKIERPLTVGLTNVSGSAKILLVESGMQLKEFEISITHGGQNTSSTDKDWNPLP